MIKKDSLDISFINNFSINYTTTATTIKDINSVMVFLMFNFALTLISKN